MQIYANEDFLNISIIIYYYIPIGYHYKLKNE